jgi:hypothetical protein
VLCRSENLDWHLHEKKTAWRRFFSSHAGDALAKSQAAFWFWMQSFPNCSPGSGDESMRKDSKDCPYFQLKACKSKYVLTSSSQLL